ncbi:MAG: hypothetical protein J2P41_21860 [Blastocatellia bacterium]|nr:hypothetical protein [Blastocatellia bacterium]
MKKQMMIMAILLGCLIAAGASRAQAQFVYPVKADIPFSFYVGEKLLPAGIYQVMEKSQGVMEIQRDDGKAAALFMFNDDQERRPPAMSDLVFNKYGDKVFLSRIEQEGNSEDAVLVKTKLEKMTAQKLDEESSVSVLLHY